MKRAEGRRDGPRVLRRLDAPVFVRVIMYAVAGGGLFAAIFLAGATSLGQTVGDFSGAEQLGLAAVFAAGALLPAGYLTYSPIRLTEEGIEYGWRGFIAWSDVEEIVEEREYVRIVAKDDDQRLFPLTIAKFAYAISTAELLEELRTLRQRYGGGGK